MPPPHTASARRRANSLPGLEHVARTPHRLPSADSARRSHPQHVDSLYSDTQYAEQGRRFIVTDDTLMRIFRALGQNLSGEDLLDRLYAVGGVDVNATPQRSHADTSHSMAEPIVLQERSVASQDSARVMGPPGPPIRSRVNTDEKKVFLQDFEGNLVSRFYQYGLIDWAQFYSCLRVIICTSTAPWAVFKFDKDAPNQQGPLCPPGPEVPAPGKYVILSPSGSPITVNLIKQRARPRHPTISNTGSREEHYRRRVKKFWYERFASTHIFPRAHDSEWVDKGYPSLITDSAPLVELGGPTKVDSLQNVMLLRSDFHNAWDNYRLAVDPDRGHIIVPFVPGYDEVAGKTLALGHITDPNIRPLDELLRDHFLQAVLKNMKGAGEPTWDYEDALGDGSMDLSRSDLWGGEGGREHLEFEMAHRLHGLVVAQAREGEEGAT